MLQAFETAAKKTPHDTCFTFVERDGCRQEITYSELRAQAMQLAFFLHKKGVRRGSNVSADMSNCPAFVILFLAAAYGGFTVIVLNHRLTEIEKTERLTDLKLIPEVSIVRHLTEEAVWEALESIQFTEDTVKKKKRFWQRSTQDVRAADEGYRRKVLQTSSEEVFHFAERNAAFFSAEARALVLFTSGTSGRPKAVPLTWDQLCRAARASNAKLNEYRAGLWQIALPLFHVGGFQAMLRSVLNASPFILYRTFNADRILRDATTFEVTHISVVDKMLQDMLSSQFVEVLKYYRCILLGGSLPNPVTLVRALTQGAKVYASYGMTETASNIASQLVTGDYDGSLSLLEGYEVQIVSPDNQGFGQLAVRGPGVFSGYLNSQTATTMDGFFLTGDVASFKQGNLKIKERLTDMFTSGGENIYPAEIEDTLLRIPGVRDAYVFGVEDEAWGHRPVACIEREEGAVGTPQRFAEDVQKSLRQRLSKLYYPEHLCVLDKFPRKSIGKTDKAVLQELYAQRLEVKEVRLYHVRQKLAKPFVTGKITMRTRESLLVEVEDWAGRVGLGECVAFETNWYLPETLDEDKRILEEHLIPLVLGQTYLHPSEVSACFDECEEAEAYPLAKGALEPAFWDLYGKVVGQPLWALLQDKVVGSTKDALVQVPAGVVLGVMPYKETLNRVQEAIDAGYSRIKIKLAPGEDASRIRTVREAFPKITIMLDANQGYTEEDIDSLKNLDDLDILCIEEPLDPYTVPAVGPAGFFERTARLQGAIKTPVCFDESLVTEADVERALGMTADTLLALKIGKCGGVQPTLDLCQQAAAAGVRVWMGGMYETGVSKYLHAAFETLPGMTIPGDLGALTPYFCTELVRPACQAEAGWIILNSPGYEQGLGCTLDHNELQKVLISQKTFSRE